MSVHALPPSDEFRAAADDLGIAFEPGDLDRLGQYLDLLRTANEQFNLTAIVEPDAMWMRHIYDALTLVPMIASAGARRIIDVGAGGGIPGIVLAVIMPDVRLALLEATGKKARFLEQTAKALGLDNVDVINDRAETVGRDPAHREQYDIAVARAVGTLPVLLELATPLVRAGGHVLAIKGEKAPDEITAAKKALHMLHCAVVGTQRTPTGTIVMIEKLRPTPRLYPRRPGEPKRAPL